jgi:hypothetical protein
MNIGVMSKVKSYWTTCLLNNNGTVGQTIIQYIKVLDVTKTMHLKNIICGISYKKYVFRR